MFFVQDTATPACARGCGEIRTDPGESAGLADSVQRPSPPSYRTSPLSGSILVGGVEAAWCRE
jgi:hypothetical protein